MKGEQKVHLGEDKTLKVAKEKPKKICSPTNQIGGWGAIKFSTKKTSYSFSMLSFNGDLIIVDNSFFGGRGNEL